MSTAAALVMFRVNNNTSSAPRKLNGTILFATCLGAAALAQDDPVRPHPQGGAHELRHGHRPHALDVAAALLEVDDVGVVGAQLAGLLDAHDPLGGRHEGQQDSQQNL